MLPAYRYGSEEATAHRQCHHAPNRLPYPLVMRVSRRLACGSHAAAPAALTIRCGSRRLPCWSRR
nr:hypothetical protein [Chloroflexus sp.]